MPCEPGFYKFSVFSSFVVRCFAVVSLDSGPTREQLDNLYMYDDILLQDDYLSRYLKENVHSNSDLDDIQDEVTLIDCLV